MQIYYGFSSLFILQIDIPQMLPSIPMSLCLYSRPCHVMSSFDLQHIHYYGRSFLAQVIDSGREHAGHPATMDGWMWQKENSPMKRRKPPVSPLLPFLGLSSPTCPLSLPLPFPFFFCCWHLYMSLWHDEKACQHEEEQREENEEEGKGRHAPEYLYMLSHAWWW